METAKRGFRHDCTTRGKRRWPLAMASPHRVSLPPGGPGSAGVRRTQPSPIQPVAPLMRYAYGQCHRRTPSSGILGNLPGRAIDYVVYGIRSHSTT